MKNVNDVQTILDEIHNITDSMSQETVLEFLEDLNYEIDLKIQNLNGLPKELEWDGDI